MTDPILNDLEKKLVTLHDAMADHLLKKVKSGEASAADLNVALGLVRYNGIDVAYGQAKGPIKALADELPFARPLAEEEDHDSSPERQAQE